LNHVMLGAALPFLVCAAIYLARGARASLGLLVLGPLAMGLSGAWAVVPDMPRALHHQDLYFRLHHYAHCNIWWFHCRIDAHEVDYVWYPVVFVLVGALLLLVAWRELARTERDAAAGRVG